MPQRAIVIFPLHPDLGVIEELRQLYNPLASNIQAHTTLGFPFEGQIGAGQLRGHVGGAVCRLLPSPLRMSSVTGF